MHEATELQCEGQQAAGLRQATCRGKHGRRLQEALLQGLMHEATELRCEGQQAACLLQATTNTDLHTD